MKILLVGYGRMGKEIEKIALDRGHTVPTKIDAIAGVGTHQTLTAQLLNEVDVVIEFALPDNMDENIKLYAQTKVPVVIGTTGWNSKLEQYKNAIINAGGRAVYGSNYSVGAHILFNLAAYATKMVDKISEYDLMITEYHHKNKKDSPSGTAITLAQQVLDNTDRKKCIQPEKLDRAILPEELHVVAVRGGSIPGIHTLTLDSDADTIEVTHNARSRGGFALGSVLAAEWITQQESGFYPVETFMKNLLSN